MIKDYLDKEIRKLYQSRNKKVEGKRMKSQPHYKRWKMLMDQIEDKKKVIKKKQSNKINDPVNKNSKFTLLRIIKKRSPKNVKSKRIRSLKKKKEETNKNIFENKIGFPLKNRYLKFFQIGKYHQKRSSSKNNLNIYYRIDESEKNFPEEILQFTNKKIKKSNVIENSTVVLYWFNKEPNFDFYNNFNSYQKVNFFPKINKMLKIENVARILTKKKYRYPKQFYNFPFFYNLPTDEKSFINEIESASKNSIFYCKSISGEESSNFISQSVSYVN